MPLSTDAEKVLVALWKRHERGKPLLFPETIAEVAVHPGDSTTICRDLLEGGFVFDDAGKLRLSYRGMSEGKRLAARET